jgi:bifunctional UDP-N-acetylglucosamine pyrophosphorylase/glucosamine-1-phosphate N-acetyltransferase
MEKIKAIILAAGKGTRMKSDLPKVLHLIQGRPMVSFAVGLARSLKIKDIIVVVGHQDQLVKKYLDKGVKLVKQSRLMGTADAVMAARTRIGKLDGDVLILYADHPLFTKETISNLVKFHLKNKSDCSFVTASVEQPKGYGRIRRDNYSRVQEIVEETDLIGHDHDIKEINLGAYCFKSKSLFSALSKIKINQKKKEYYLTDAIGILSQEKAKVEAFLIEDSAQALGINSQEDLAKANQIMRLRITQDFVAKGVSIIDPLNTYIDSSAIIGKDTIIYPFTVIEADVKIGKSCRIGPFCHIRPKSIVMDEAEVGNFTELNRSKIGENTIMKHFSYLGDAIVGKNVNIGAGTVTANYDGKDKHPTYIKDRAFIGSDTVLIAPVKVGKASVTAAGSVLTKNRNVPDKTVVAGVPAKILSRRRKNE